VVNQLHGWTCPTCGTERSECDVGQGTSTLEAPVLADGIASANEVLRAENRAIAQATAPRRDNSAITASCRRAADEVGCSAPLGHEWLSSVSTDSSVPTSTWCKHCGLALLPEPPTSTKPVDLTPTLQDARAIPCDEARTHHLWWTRDDGQVRCMNCGLVVRDS